MQKLKFQLDKYKKLNMNQLITIFAGMILVLQIIAILYCNLFLTENYVDADSSKLIIRIMKMWEHKSLVIPGWKHMTTMEWDCSTLLALPLYAITKNIFLSVGIANVLFALVYIGLMFILFRDKHPLYPILTSIFILVPYSVGMLDYFNMMFFGGAQYVIKVLVPLLLITLLLEYEKDTSKIGRRVLAGIVLVLSFITTASSGLYVLLVGILPIYLTYFLYKLLKNERVSLEVVAITITNFLVSFAGIVLNNQLGAAKGNSMVLIAVQDVFQNIVSCLIGIWELLGGVSHTLDTAIVSVEGICVLVKSCFAILFVICSIVAFVRFLHKKGDLRVTLLLAMIVWNLFILFHSKTSYGSATYEYRYHLITVVPMMCLATLVLLDGWMNFAKTQKVVFAGIAAIAIIALNSISFYQIISAPDKNEEYKELVNYCDNLNVEFVYMYGDSEGSEIARLLSGYNKQYLQATDGGASVVHGYYEKYHAMPLVKENAIMVVDDPNMEKGTYFELAGYGLEYFDSVGEKNLYWIVEPKTNN